MLVVSVRVSRLPPRSAAAVVAAGGAVTDDEVEPYAAVAVELVQRVRDEAPADVGRWLSAVLPNPADWWHLCFVLAAAVPDDRPWQHSTAWAAQPRTDANRAAVEALTAERFGHVMPKDLPRRAA